MNILLSVFMSAALLATAAEPPRGRLVVVGGGATRPEVYERILELAGGKQARVVVVPQASRDPEAGQKMAARWQEVGAGEVVVLDPTQPRIARSAIESADLIWVRGGSQTRLMEALAGTGLPEAIRARFHRGAVIGGTSAGAAVMSRVMITGWSGGQADSVRTAEGLGLWPEVIVDQHFIRRHRFERLKGVVLDHPDLVGIGIDEATAVVVTGRQFEVIGESDVVVIDARKLASALDKDRDKAAAKVARDAADVATQILKPGMKYDLDAGVMAGPIASGG